jgi:molybdopterin-containing oxidoreductase family membrane subunit
MVHTSAASEKYPGDEVMKEKLKSLFAYFSRVLEVMKEKLKPLLDYSSEAVKETGKGFYVYLGVLLLIILLAGVNWFHMILVGAGVTDSSDFVPWGIFIVGFVFFVGASAGATIIGLMIYAFDRTDYKALGIRAIIFGLLSLVAAVLNLLGDVGVPWRTLLIPWVLRNMTSMLIYTTSTYMLFFMLLSAELYFALRIVLGSKEEFDKTMAKWLAIVAVPFALVVLHAPHGALFAVVKAREYWHSALLPAHFAVSAMVTGTALMILITIVTSTVDKRQLVKTDTLVHMGKLLAFFITVNIFFDFFDIFVLKYSEEIEGIEAWELLTSRFMPMFLWNFVGLFGGLFVLLSKKGKTIKGLSVASCLTVTGIIAYRYYLIVVAQIVPLQPGLPEVYYYPTFTEWSISAGIVALILFLYAVLTKLLPMEARDLEGRRVEQ